MLMIFMLIKQSTFVNFSCQFKTKRELFAFHSDLYELDSSILQLAKYYKSVVYTSRDSASQTIHTSNFNNLCTIVRVNWPFEFVRDKQENLLKITVVTARATWSTSDKFLNSGWILRIALARSVVILIQMAMNDLLAVIPCWPALKMPNWKLLT